MSWAKLYEKGHGKGTFTPRLSHCLHSYVLPTHLAKGKQEVLLGLNMSTDANKLVQSNVSSMNKNALLTTLTFNVSLSSIQSVVKVLGVHPRAIGVAKLRQQLANKEAKELWTLRVHKVKVDVVSIEVCNCVVNRWITQTRVNLNKNDVTQLKVGLDEHEMKPTHYLMETQGRHSSFGNFEVDLSNWIVDIGSHGLLGN